MKNPILCFDGVCNLCNGIIDFIIKRDRKKQFRFVALQTELGKKLISTIKVPAETNSVILIYKNKIYIESDAAIELSRLLGFPWNISLVFLIFPKHWRDKIYRWLAKNRYYWFGKKETCRIPTPEEKIFFPEKIDLQF